MSLATRNPQVGLRLLCVLQQTFPPVLSQRLGGWGGGPLWFSVTSIFIKKKIKLYVFGQCDKGALNLPVLFAKEVPPLITTI